MKDKECLKNSNIFSSENKSNTTFKHRKFVQVHTFYESYLNELYLENPLLQNETFENQISELLSDGFSGNHLFAPYLTEYFESSTLIIANCIHSQTQWFKQYSTKNIKTDDWIKDIVRLQIETIKPDILYLTDPITFDGRFISSLSYKPDFIFGWRAAPIPSETRWNGFDLIVSNLKGVREIALKLGATSAEHFAPGYPTQINNSINIKSPDYDVCFAGQWSWGHENRNLLLTKIVQNSSNYPKYSCGLFISGLENTFPSEIKNLNLGGKFGRQYYKSLRAGKICFDARGSAISLIDPITGKNIDLAGEEGGSMRMFESTGMGAFLLTEHYQNIGDYFEPGKEIETYQSEAELIEKIHYYLAHDEKRIEIALKGQERCLFQYSMEKKAHELLNILKKHICKLDPVNTITENVNTDQNNMSLKTFEISTYENKRLVEDAISQALEFLKQENGEEALKVIVEAKKLKIPVQDLDHVRALTFIQLRRFGDARESLKEELRNFPDRVEIIKLLNSVQNEENLINKNEFVQSVKPYDGDLEFTYILGIIKPYTMLSEERLYSLFTNAKKICSVDIKGDFVECGVAGGGSSALLGYVIKKYSKSERFLYAFDSFSGMPSPTSEDKYEGVYAEDTGWGTGTCSAPESSLREVCSKLDINNFIKPVKGYFENTLPKNKNNFNSIAVLHLDGDWYESTKTILDNLYDKVATGGFLQIDDYGYWEGCRKAVHEFEANIGTLFTLNAIDGTGVWMTKK